MDYAHENGIVHRDIKPANLMIEPGGRIRLADFGIAKPLEDPATITSPGEMVGTISYVAPEIIAGEPASPASDIYSLAAVAYEMLTGEKPYSADTTAGLLECDPPIGRARPWPGKSPRRWSRHSRRAMARDPCDAPCLGPRLRRGTGPAVDPGDARRNARCRVRSNGASTARRVIRRANGPGSSPSQTSQTSQTSQASEASQTRDRGCRPEAACSRAGYSSVGRTRRTMALAGGLVLVVVIAAFMSGALDAGDGREADEQAIQDESTTTNSPTTTSTIALRPHRRR